MQYLAEAPPLNGDPAELYVATLIRPKFDPSATYRLPVPRGWKCADEFGEMPESLEVQKPLGMFASGPNRRDRSILIAVTLLPVEVRLEDWAAETFVKKKWLVADQRWIETPRGPRLVTWGTKEDLVRASVFFADGGRVYSIHCFGPAQLQSLVARDLWWSALAIRLAQPAGAGLLEARKPVECAGNTFSVPFSWEPAAPVHSRSGTRVRLRLPSCGATNRGLIEARFGDSSEDSDGDSIEERLRKALLRLRRAGWLFAEAERPIPANRMGRVTGWRTWQLRAQAPSSASSKGRWGRPNDPFDLRIGFREGSAPVELLAVGARSDRRAWMRTVRAMEVAMESLEPRGVTPRA